MIRSLQVITGRIREFFEPFFDSFTVRARSFVRRSSFAYQEPAATWARPDYVFWLKVYRAQIRGLEVSGLLVKPIVNKLATWSLGRPPKWILDDEVAQQALTDWWKTAHAKILRGWHNSLRQGDAFLVINPDLTVTIVAPENVDPIVNETDYSIIEGWRITQVLMHPVSQRRMTMVDEYYADRRVHEVQINGILQARQEYPNLLGRWPLVHIANQPDPGETFGRPEVEGLLPLMDRYGKVIDAATEGNILQGRPTPVLTFASVQDLEKFDSENAIVETQVGADNQISRVKIYDVDLSQLLVVSGADFEYKAPGTFTADTAKLLELFFYLLLEHSELPEFVFGNAIASSMASAETQMPIFIEFIKGRQGEMVDWLTDIAEIAMGYLSLTQPAISAMIPTLQWEALDQQDGTLTLETIKWAFLEGLIDELTALRLIPVDIEDPQGVLDKAKEEREAARVEFPESTPEEEQFDSDLASEINDLELD
jgi:hypothetical protein